MTNGPEDGEGNDLWNRLRHRKVVQWGVAYSAGSWGFLQGLSYLSTVFAWPPQIQRFATVAFLAGLPIAIVLAWYHGDRGHQKVSGQEFAILTVLLLTGGTLFWWVGRIPVIVQGPAAAPTTQARELAESGTSIAVLPFVNMSSDPEQEYFSDGLSEELINLLVKLPDLKVIARTSSFAYKGKDTRIADIAKELGVAHVLEGSVRKAGDKLRITAQLIHAADSTHLWSETYDRQLTDIFAIQDEIAAEVVRALEPTLGVTPAASSVPRDLDAYHLFLKGRHLAQGLTKSELERATTLFERSLERNPDYAPAWVELARARVLQEDFGLLDRPESYDRAREAVGRALTLDPNSAGALSLMGWIRTVDFDWTGAEANFRRALEIEPGNADAILRAGWIAAEQGRYEEGLRLVRKAIELDPLRVSGYDYLGYLLGVTGHMDERDQAFRKLIELSPEDGPYYRGRMLIDSGDLEEALEEYQQVPDNAWTLLGLSEIHFKLGQDEQSRVALIEATEKYGHLLPFDIAGAHAIRGEADRAFEWLDLAYRQRNVRLADFKLNPDMTLLAGDPRYKQMLRKLNLPE